MKNVNKGLALLTVGTLLGGGLSLALAETAAAGITRSAPSAHQPSNAKKKKPHTKKQQPATPQKSTKGG